MVSSSTEGVLPTPPGHEADFDLSHNPLRTTYTVALLLILVFPTIAVPLRIYTKAVIVKSFKITDVACFIGFTAFIALITLGFVFLNIGMGKHAWDLHLHSYSRLAELLNIQQTVYMPAILFTKVAVLLQLKEIFVPQQMTRGSRWYSLMVLLVANVVFFTTLMFVEILQCIPRKKIWNPSTEGHCIDINRTFVATGVINVVDDFIILIIPIVWTWKLQLRTRQKIGVCLIFATGFFACITSVMRLVESIKSLNNPDISVSLVPVSLWAVAEVSAGLVVCCLPLLPRLFGRRNVRTRLSPSERSDRSNFFKRATSQIDILSTENGHSLHSTPSLPDEIGGNNKSYIMKSISLDQSSTRV